MKKPVKQNLPYTSPGPGEEPAKPGDKLGTKGTPISLAEAMSTKTNYSVFNTWIIGLKPLIVHSWSQKAKVEMLQKQLKTVQGRGRDARKPEQDFIDSIYRMGKGKDGKERYGFPATGIKKSLLSAAHKDKGLAKSVALSSLWLDAEMVAVKTAVPNAICDLPLVRIWGDEPVMREDMVRVGTGLNKTASLAYRGQISRWAINIQGRFNVASMSAQALAFLVNDAGLACGIGEWRNEKGGVFGAYKLANVDEEDAWNRYAAGKGPLPELFDEYAIAAE